MPAKTPPTPATAPAPDPAERYEEPDAPLWRALRAAIEAGKTEAAEKLCRELDIEPELVSLFSMMLEHVPRLKARIAAAEAAQSQLPALRAELGAAYQAAPQTVEECARIAQFRSELEKRLHETQVAAADGRVPDDELIEMQRYAPGLLDSRPCRVMYFRLPVPIYDWLRERGIPQDRPEGFRTWRRPSAKPVKRQWTAMG